MPEPRRAVLHDVGAFLVENPAEARRSDIESAKDFALAGWGGPRTHAFYDTLMEEMDFRLDGANPLF